MLDATREYWGGQAADFDRDADHGLPAPGFRRRLSSCRVMLLNRPTGRQAATLSWSATGCGRSRTRTTPSVRRARLLRTPGTMLLVEGLWGTGAGIPSGTCQEFVLRHRRHADVLPLTDPALWGREIGNERYLVISRS